MSSEVFDELNHCLVLAESEQPPTPTCGNCQHFTQTKWYRLVFEGKTGYCWQLNQNRRKTDTCPEHQFIDEF